ncbi:hypothetical protein EVAR_33066_1 [Eumeta japonica]|uniref:Uncharacterized protein n=1 Tax=Eumeta variegata TaxID=151549 RepID=A0A4C1WWV5_EUMVA|nr:hypothetical protein EVAR_33066_1 [Eumeta japonica]
MDSVSGGMTRARMSARRRAAHRELSCLSIWVEFYTFHLTINKPHDLLLTRKRLPKLNRVSSPGWTDELAITRSEVCLPSDGQKKKIRYEIEP